MPGCVLHVVGKALDPDTVLSQLTLQPYLKFRTGDRVFGRIAEKGGFKCNVSSSDGVLSQEIAHAIEFLITHKSDLRTLGSAPSVEEMSLDFGHHLRIDGQEILFQTDFLPAELLNRCGSLGIGIYLSLYPTPAGIAHQKDR